MLTIKLKNTTIKITFDISFPSSVLPSIITPASIAGRPADNATPQKIKKLQIIFDILSKPSSSNKRPMVDFAPSTKDYPVKAIMMTV